jgi:hypothetical protein
MNENRTTAILQRFAVILAVTAASYGLQPQAQAQAARTGGNGQQSQTAGPQR